MVATAMTRDGLIDHRGHRVWWGACEPSLSGGVPLLTVHGGPGICHDCLEPLTTLAAERPVVFYDQYGCGRSDRAADRAEYDVQLFVDELGAVRDALGLERVHLFAHSYGGPIALQYLLSGGDPGVVSLTLSNSFASVPALASGWRRRLAEMPRDAGAALAGSPAADPDAYGAALGEFITRYVLPFPPPEPLIRSQEHSGSDVYERMHGTSWFQPDGAWADWDAIDRLSMINVPTLVIGGTRDQCVPELAMAIGDAMPHADVHILDAAHLPFFEVPDIYFGLIGNFLRSCERAANTGSAAGTS